MTWKQHCDACGRADPEQFPIGWITVSIIMGTRPLDPSDLGAFSIFRPGSKQVDSRGYIFCSLACLQIFASLETHEEPRA